MKMWQFSEQAYHPAFQVPGSMRVTLSAEHCDPVEAGQLYNRYLDEYALADEVGLNIMVNEHHAAATCMSTSCLQTLAILARTTKKARLLALGVPLANRANPVRVAEEAAMVDCISGGRLELGLVKGASYELFMSNRQPTGFMDRFWEAHDLVLAALSNTGENFAWDGDHFHYRTVSLWPRPIQSPPPIWMTASSAGSAREHGKLGYTCATFLSGAVARNVFTGYREAYLAEHGHAAPEERLGYLGLVACASDTETAKRRAGQMRSYFTTASRLESQYRSPWGFLPVSDTVRMMTSTTNMFRPKMRNGEILPVDASVDDYMSAGLMFVGTPDEVYDQIAQFYGEVGGFGNMLMMGQAGELNHADTVDSLTLIGKEVAPRLAELSGEAAEVRYEGFA